MVRRPAHRQRNSHNRGQQRKRNTHRPSRLAKHDRAVGERNEQTAPRQLQRPGNAKDVAEQEKMSQDKRDDERDPARGWPDCNPGDRSDDDHAAVND